MKFNKNVGVVDQVTRLVLGLSMIYFGFISDLLIVDRVAGTLLGGFGIALLLISVLRFCPLYLLIGFNSCADNNDVKN